MKTILLLLIASFFPSLALSENDYRFSYGYGLGRMVEADTCTVAIGRLNEEANRIAMAVVGAARANDLAIKIEYDERSSRGFQTWFACSKAIEKDLGPDLFREIHTTIARRYNELVLSIELGSDILNPATAPIEPFLKKINKQGEATQ